MMDLNTICFLMFGLLFSGFLLLEGFDYGVGMLLPFYAKTDVERRAMIATLAPVWEGNEVWLIAAGAFLFAGFPGAYATLFSGMYLALLLILAPLILRGVAFEFRDKEENGCWRSFWDWSLFAGSLLPAVLWGIAVGNLLEGLPVDAAMQYAGSFWDLLSPYTLLSGLFFALLFLLHGATYLTVKLDERLAAGFRRLAAALCRYALGAALLFAVATYIIAGIKVITAAAFLLVVLSITAVSHCLGERRFTKGLIFSGLTIAAAAGAIFAQLYPRIIVSSLSPQWSITIYNSAANPLSLKIMSIAMAVVFPAVLVFEIWKYRIFRHRITTAEIARAGQDDEAARSNRELRGLVAHARCLADVMDCVIRALRSDDGRVIGRLRPKHRALLLSKSRPNGEGEE